MTRDDIDHLLDFMANEAKEKGDDCLLPGEISMSADAWGRLPHGVARCTNILHGIRYRGIQVLVTRDRENQVLNRAAAGEQAKPFFDLEPKA